jgi:hypothetical protein
MSSRYASGVPIGSDQENDVISCTEPRGTSATMTLCCHSTGQGVCQPRLRRGRTVETWSGVVPGGSPRSTNVYTFSLPGSTDWVFIPSSDVSEEDEIYEREWEWDVRIRADGA